MTKIGNFFTSCLLLLAVGSSGLGVSRALADEPSFSAEVDHSYIGLDESVSLKLKVTVDGNTNLGTPSFSAPGFEIVNEYSSTFVKSYYENGQFGSQNEVETTKVLKPMKGGDLRISQLKVSAGGKTLTAPDIVIHVGQAGAGTPPPNSYGGGGIGLRGASRSNVAPVLVRAEIDKSKAYKGEQIVVSYYLLHRVRMFNISVEKFPNLNGFLREELEMPVMGSALTSEKTVVNGVSYEKSLLARYAVYPLQEGKLSIDPMELKYNYYGDTRGARGDDDPFQNFFQQLTPLAAQSDSDPLSVEVIPLPEEGKPASFSGGVGDFAVTSAVDKYEVRANEAVTLKVVVQGRGNIAAIGEPKGNWPANVELYDSKGTAKTGKAGVGEKTFEFLLIPRAPGKVTLPPLEFSFFDPAKQAYVTRATQAIDLTVKEPAPGSALPQQPKLSGGSALPSVATGNPGSDNVADLKSLAPGALGTASGGLVRGQPIWRWVYWLCAAAFIFFVFLVTRDKLKSLNQRAQETELAKSKLRNKNFQKLRDRALVSASPGGAWPEVVQCYEALTQSVFDAIDRKFAVGARGFSRSQLEELLVNERGLPAELWTKISSLLEYAEIVRFASSAGAVSEREARESLANWVNQAEQLIESIEIIRYK